MPQLSITLPEFGIPSHPKHDFPSPPHLLQISYFLPSQSQNGCLGVPLHPLFGSIDGHGVPPNFGG